MKIMNGLDLQSQKVTNLADPSTNTDAANKQYVDNVARGLYWKAPVRVATTTNGTLATAFANGQSIDGVTLATGDRILLKDQTTGSENGIYTVNASGAPTRATDADGGTELAPGTAVTVTGGTTNGDKVFMITSDAAITVGTTAQTWGQLGGGGTSYSAGNGISISSNIISAVAGNGIVVDGTGIRLGTSVAARKFSANIGNGASTSIAVTHSLGTKDVTVAVRATADDSHVIADVVSTDTNTVTVTFASAPATNAYRVTVVG
jgi:hypothetical protein